MNNQEAELFATHQNLIHKHVELYEQNKKLREVAESMAEALKFVLKDNEQAMMYEGIGSESTSKIETALQSWYDLTQNRE